MITCDGLKPTRAKGREGDTRAGRRASETTLNALFMVLSIFEQPTLRPLLTFYFSLFILPSRISFLSRLQTISASRTCHPVRVVILFLGFLGVESSRLNEVFGWNLARRCHEQSSNNCKSVGVQYRFDCNEYKR